MYLLDEARDDDVYDEALRASCMEVLDRSFVSARRNIRLSKVVRASTSTTATTTADDRNHAIDAAVVRIMKARRVVAHADLVVLLDADVRQIKQRIEDLIGREYISRDEADPKIYHYVP
jgi:cullin 1